VLAELREKLTAFAGNRAVQITGAVVVGFFTIFGSLDLFKSNPAPPPPAPTINLNVDQSVSTTTPPAPVAPLPPRPEFKPSPAPAPLPAMPLQELRPNPDGGQVIVGPYLPPRRSMGIESRVKICIGTVESRCPPHDVFLRCGADVADWARKNCPRFEAEAVASAAAQTCGHIVHTVTCQAQARD
jgi:hypothetical protein